MLDLNLNFDNFINTLTTDRSLKRRLYFIKEVATNYSLYFRYCSDFTEKNLYCLQQIHALASHGMHIKSIREIFSNSIRMYEGTHFEHEFLDQYVNEFLNTRLTSIGFNSEISYDPESPISKAILNSVILECAIRAINQTGKMNGYNISLMCGGYDTPLNYLPSILWDAYQKSIPGMISNKYPISIVEGLETPLIENGVIYPIDHILSMLNKPDKNSIIIRIDYLGG